MKTKKSIKNFQFEKKTIVNFNQMKSIHGGLGEGANTISFTMTTDTGNGHDTIHFDTKINN
ncbi:MAG: hypothetical protein QM535_01020 [Limnohabitans sp.]|nr:hypothetical protein [Limnohabitans sp.]